MCSIFNFFSCFRRQRDIVVEYTGDPKDSLYNKLYTKKKKSKYPKIR